MWLYILIILFIAYLAYQELNGVRFSKSGLLFALGGLCLFVGLGDMLGGYDRYIYADLFDNVADVINSGSSNFKDAYIFDIYSSEFGYCWLNVLIGYITRNRYIF
ncbi:MAG: EpsG family protein, partial [Bacteroidaceae bacterium]|nr:EpsG family protein [Bacteroidaceae bacterium]